MIGFRHPGDHPVALDELREPTTRILKILLPARLGDHIVEGLLLAVALAVELHLVLALSCM